MLIVAYRLSEGHTINLNVLMLPWGIEVLTRLNNEALFTQLNGYIQSDNLALPRTRWSDTHMRCILESYIKRATTLQRIKKLHREWSIRVKLNGA